jgi:hypothetical protein
MVNAWSLAYDVINGPLDENFPPMTDKNRVTPLESDEYDPITTVGSGSTDSAVFVDFNLNDQIDTVTIDTSNSNTLIDFTNLEMSSVDQDYISFSSEPETLNIKVPGIETDNPRKYKEDESIKALQDYISTTYGGHYTSKQNNVQTLDLIESVGDAESFCRSNAIKYLSRYDKKGQAKRDILKALHYTLLLYHFSGQLNETPTRGYETF